MSEALLRETIAARFKPYSEYRDSGVEWLGEVPSAWAVAPLYARYSVDLGKMLDSNRITGEHLAPYLRNADVQWDKVRIDNLPEMDFSPREKERFSLRIGDLLVCEGGEVGRTAQWRGELQECYYQKAIHRLRPISKREYPRYFFYVMTAAANLGAFLADRNPNTIDHLTAVKLRHYKFPFPSDTEQRTIAAFLDRETAKIDALIAKKERLIELLQEKRAAMITQAVTKGLDPSVPMKDSRVEWVKQIPQHWKVRQNRYLFRERDERDFPDLPLLNVSISSGVSLREFSEDRIEQQAQDPGTYKRALAGDIAFNKMRMWQGAVGVVPIDGLVSPDYIVATPVGQINPRYYELLFRTASYMTEVNRYSHGIVPDRNRLYWDDFAQLKSLMPPIYEQHIILNQVEHVTRAIDELIANISTGADLLKEYRTALISAAVTGKIDVRGDPA